MSKILIVDDAKLMRNMIKNILIKNGDHQIIEATNGQDAIEVFKAVKPALITMDITMDVKNGVDAAKEILSIDPKAKIIMVTALGQEEFLKECIAMGVNDFIVKPFNEDRVLKAVEKVLAATNK